PVQSIDDDAQTVRAQTDHDAVRRDREWDVEILVGARAVGDEVLNARAPEARPDEGELVRSDADERVRVPGLHPEFLSLAERERDVTEAGERGRFGRVVGGAGEGGARIGLSAGAGARRGLSTRAGLRGSTARRAVSRGAALATARVAHAGGAAALGEGAGASGKRGRAAAPAARNGRRRPIVTVPTGSDHAEASDDRQRETRH